MQKSSKASKKQILSKAALEQRKAKRRLEKKQSPAETANINNKTGGTNEAKTKIPQQDIVDAVASSAVARIESWLPRRFVHPPPTPSFHNQDKTPWSHLPFKTPASCTPWMEKSSLDLTAEIERFTEFVQVSSTLHLSNPTVPTIILQFQCTHS
jgi:hypothetical protein